VASAELVVAAALRLRKRLAAPLDLVSWGLRRIGGSSGGGSRRRRTRRSCGGRRTITITPGRLDLEWQTARPIRVAATDVATRRTFTAEMIGLAGRRVMLVFLVRVVVEASGRVAKQLSIAAVL